MYEVFKAWLTARLGVANERGANLIEYILLVVLIAIVVIVVLNSIGFGVRGKYSSVTSRVG